MATILLQNVGASTLSFTQKLQLAANGTNYPLGTTFDCTAYTNQSIISTIAFTRANNTFIFGAGTFSYTAASGSMFEISAQGITIIGTNRNAKDVATPGGTTSFTMGGGSGMGYHINYKVTAVPAGSVKGDCLVVKNCSFKSVPSTYTQNNGNVQYTTYGGGGFLIMESNPGLAGQNINNVIIDNVLIDGARQHGIFIYGAVASKITNTRVRNAAGHGFYIDGESTSVSFDTCYASGNYLAGFCLKDAAYSSLLNCASDSNGLGYWLRNSTSTTLVSCGAEANVSRSNIPNNLGIVLAGSTVSPAVSINDIGADNVNYIKGTSYFISGGSNLTLTSPISKDPGGNPSATTYPNKRTAHFGFYGGTSNVTITSPRRSGTAPVKYSYRLEGLSGSGSPSYITIGETGLTYDPLNPAETPDTNMAPVANILDQGKANLFIAGGEDQSASGKLTTISDPGYHQINNLSATSKLTIPTYDSHPAADTDTTIYFNSVNKKLYMWQDGVWYDTCCASPTPEPDCYFPGGFGQVGFTGQPGSGMVTTRGHYAQSGDKIFYPVGYSPNLAIWSTTVGLQSYDLVTNTLIDYPNTLNMRLSNSLVAGYNPDNEKGIYFAAIVNIAGSPGSQMPPIEPTISTPYRSIVGFYNLVTGVCTTGIDTVIEDYNLQSTEALAAYRMIKFDNDDSLYFLSPNDGIIQVSTEDWSTLGITPFTGANASTTAMGPLNSTANIGFDGVTNFYTVETNGSKFAVIPRKSTYNQGLAAQVSLINFANGLISHFNSSTDTISDNYNTTNLISTDPETGNLIVVNCSLRTIAEFNTSLNLVNEWNVGTTNDIIGYPTFYTSNGKRFALFMKYTATDITAGSPFSSSFVCYNLTDSIVEGSIVVPNGPSGQVPQSPFAFVWEQGMSFAPEIDQNVPAYSQNSTKIHLFYYNAFYPSMSAVCKPYHPAG